MKRELRLFLRDPSMWMLATVYALLLAYGSMQGIAGYHAAADQIAKTRAEYDNRWRAMIRSASSAKVEIWGSWRSASLAGSEQGGAVAWKEPDSLSVLNLGHGSRENPVRRISLYDSPVEPPLGNPVNSMYGSMDLGFVVLWILPLVALLAAYQVLGRDWDAGVWPLIVVSGTSLRRLVLARMALPFGILLVLTMTAAIVSLKATSGRLPFELVIWTVAIVLYMVTWMALGAWLGLQPRNPSRQLLIAGGLWLGCVWVAPGLIDAVAELAVPRVSAAEGLLAARDAQISSTQRSASLMQRVYQEHPEWKPAQELVERMNRPVPGGPRRRDARFVYASYLAGEEAVAPSRERLAQRRKQVEEIASRFALATPLVAMQYLTEEVAGNSFRQYREFGDRADAFLKEWRAYFAGKVWRLEEMSLSDIEQRPRFRPEATTAGSQIERVALPAGGLILWSAVMGLALHWRIRRFSLS